MSDKESNPASLDASDASTPAEIGSREVKHAPPPLGSEENSESDAGVAARTRLQVRLQNPAGADILDPVRIADPQMRSDPTAESTSASNDGSSARNEASPSLHGVATLSDPTAESTSASNDGST